MFSVKLMCRNFIDLLNEFHCMAVFRVCLLLLRFAVYCTSIYITNSVTIFFLSPKMMHMNVMWCSVVWSGAVKPITAAATANKMSKYAYACLVQLY